jgi:hypothetical protein
VFIMHVRFFRSTLFTLAIITITAGTLTLRAAVPTAPTNLTATVSGLSVSLSWGASANAPTQYVLQAGFAPGQTAITVPLSGSTTTFSASAAAGTYYVRVVAVNADGTSAPSNEVTVVLTAGAGTPPGCAAPSAPLNLRAIILGGEAFIFWRPPVAGTPNGYSLQAGGAPGQTFAQYPTAATTLNANVGGGVYYIRVVATSACGNSPASNELQLVFPSNTVRVADPDPGTSLGYPDVSALINRIHNENPGMLAQQCPNGRKYENNPWQDRIVDRLRQYDTRFGYNAKPTRTAVDNNGFPVTAAGDEITFFAGAGTAQGSPNVHAFDILSDHCGVRPSQDVFRNIAPEPAVWTSVGRFTGDAREQQE